MTNPSDLRILLVEDSAGLRRVYQKLLEGCGFRVRTAENGEDALAVLGTDDGFDVIVSDIGMPLMDGCEFARRIRANPTYESKRLIALTAYSQLSLIEQVREVGFDIYLTKPINIADLRDAICDVPLAEDHLSRQPEEQSVAPLRRIDFNTTAARRN